jgi:hypothetical protein
MLQFPHFSWYFSRIFSRSEQVYCFWHLGQFDSYFNENKAHSLHFDGQRQIWIKVLLLRELQLQGDGLLGLFSD